MCGSLCHLRKRSCANYPTDLTTSSDVSHTIGFSSEWIEIGDTILFPEDRELLESDGWLNDKHINAAQTLLKVQHSHISSLQNTLLQQIDGFPVQGNKYLSSALI